MRNFKKLFYFVLVLTFLGFSNFFIIREFLLIYSLNKTRDIFNKAILAKNDSKNRQYCISYCKRVDKKFSIDSQVRFINSYKLNQEIVCCSDEESTKVIESLTLPPLVKKYSKNAGVLIDYTNQGVILETLGEYGVVTFDEEHVAKFFKIKDPTDPKYQFAIGPISKCSVYGFYCCKDNGTGERLDEALDCKDSCFESCKDKPKLMSFSTLPLMDTTIRKVSITVEEPVEFIYKIEPSSVMKAELENKRNMNLFFKFVNYEYELYQNLVLHRPIEKPKYETVKVNIDFGDGQKTSIYGIGGSVVHRYTCNTSLCQFEARISSNDVVIDDSLAKITVDVSN